MIIIKKTLANIKNYSVMLFWLITYVLVVLGTLLFNILALVLSVLWWPLTLGSDASTSWLKGRSVRITRQQ